MSFLKVGVIGANAQSGWARESHIPAIQALPGLELAAVATSSPATAKAAASTFGVRAYADGFELCSNPSIDIVTVATRVPDHRALVIAALAAGKHVYCEWPLSMGSVEAETLFTAAKSAGRLTAIGLQLRANPAVRRARQLIADGTIGRVLGINVFSATAGFGPIVPDVYISLEEPENFANLVTIQGAHTVDLARYLVGEPETFSAFTSRQFPEIQVGVTKEHRQRKTFDHLLFHGETGDGTSIVMEVAGGRPPKTPMRLEISGEEGVLTLSGAAPRGIQSGYLQLLLNGQALPVEDGELAGLMPTAVNVGGIYAALRDSIADPHVAEPVPGFEVAVNLSRLVEAFFESSSSGRRIAWPAAAANRRAP